MLVISKSVVEVDSVDLIAVSLLFPCVFVSFDCVAVIIVFAEYVGSGSIPKSAQSGVGI